MANPLKKAILVRSNMEVAEQLFGSKAVSAGGRLIPTKEVAAALRVFGRTTKEI